jgi:hypothetical protein
MIDPLAAVRPNANAGSPKAIKSFFEFVEIQVKKKYKLTHPKTVALESGWPINVVTL